MPRDEVENTKFIVPIQFGYLIGNTLRQFAIRGAETWQVAAYRVGARAGTYGFSGGHSFNYLDLLGGSLICNDETQMGGSKLCSLTYEDGVYVGYSNGNKMTVTGLGELGVSRIDVCLVCYTGSRTAAQNYEVVKKLSPGNADEFIAVPSKHTTAVTFKYDIKPYDLLHEQLNINATKGVVALALQSISNSFSGLQASLV